MSFQPKSKIAEVINFHVPDYLAQGFNAVLEKSGLTKQELLRQMVGHCLKTVKFDKQHAPIEKGVRDEF